MSLIQRIRDKSALLIFILIALSLIAFVLQDAFVGRTGNLFAENGSQIGQVGSAPIEKKEVDDLYDKTTDNYKKQQMTISEEMRYLILDNVWNNITFSKVSALEQEKIGINIAQKEFDEIFFGQNVHPYIRQQFTDSKTGAYNEESVKNYLIQVRKLKNDNPEKISFLTYFVKPILDAELTEKLTTLFSSAVYFPTWMTKKIEENANVVSAIKATQIAYTSLPDSAYHVSKEEIKKYIETNHPELQLKAKTKTLQIVSFSITPSKEDSAVALAKANAIKEKLQNTSDLKKALLLNGADKNYVNSFIRLKDFPEAEQKTISTLTPKQIVGPTLNNSKMELTVLLNKKEIPDSITCRHILIATNGKISRSDSLAKKIADSMPYYLAHGFSFEDLVTKYSDDDGSKESKGVYTFPYSQYGGLVKEFADMVFFGKTGEKKVIKTSFGYHYIENMKQAKSQTAYQVGFIRKNIEASKSTIDSINQIALNFTTHVNQADQFATEANKAKLSVSMAAVDENSYQSSLGYIRPIVRWAFDNKVNAISNIISIGDKMYVATITKEFKKGDINVNDAPFYIQNKILQQKKATAIIEKNKPSATSLETIAANNNSTIHVVDSLSLNNSFVSIYGLEPALVASAFNKNAKNKTSVIAGNSGVYYYIVNDIQSTEKGNQPANLTAKQKQVNNEIESVLKKQYVIKDLRSNFY